MLLFWFTVLLFSLWLGIEFSLKVTPLLSAFSASVALCGALCALSSRMQILIYLATFTFLHLLSAIKLANAKQP